MGQVRGDNRGQRDHASLHSGVCKCYMMHWEGRIQWRSGRYPCFAGLLIHGLLRSYILLPNGHANSLYDYRNEYRIECNELKTPDRYMLLIGLLNKI